MSTRIAASAPAISAAQPTMRPAGYHSIAFMAWPCGVGAGRDSSTRWERSAIGAAIDSAKMAAVAGPKLAAITTVPASAAIRAALPPQPSPARQSGSGAR